jgi:hypothetical protein
MLRMAAFSAAGALVAGCCCFGAGEARAQVTGRHEDGEDYRESSLSLQCACGIQVGLNGGRRSETGYPSDPDPDPDPGPEAPTSGKAYTQAALPIGLAGTDRWTSAEFLVGRRWSLDKGEVSAWAGPAYEHHKVSSTLNPVRGSEWGAKLRLQVETAPTPDWKLRAAASYSTVFDSYDVGADVGVRLFRTGLFVGPEARWTGNELFERRSAGLMVRGLGVGRFEFGLSGGEADDDRLGSGPYGRLTVSLRL